MAPPNGSLIVPGATPCQFADDKDSIEKIAICGLACRLPGNVKSGSDLWKMLVSGRSGQCDVPASRINLDGFYHPEALNRSESLNMRGGYFLQEDVRDFENDFFSINNLEAAYMDPQQRKLLEVVYECLESAGVTLQDVAGANIGCYIGNFTYDYSMMMARDIDNIHRYSSIGSAASILANRVSHVFGLVGPSLVVDTACSSSLYALHMACVALENRECDAAIVGGVNIIQSVEQHLRIMQGGFLSKSSTCHTFDASADGYARADGISALYLKRLSDALRDGDPIRSVVRGTAINSDGRTPGIAQPSGMRQEAVIQKAYAKAQLDPRDTFYVECHGTGTPVGDPIEVKAVSHAFATRKMPEPLLIGSVKPNLGHSEAASGISSVIKATLALENAYIPPTIGVKQLNPNIKAAERNVKVVEKGHPLPDGQEPRRVSISSFGFGGANAHVIIDDALACIPDMKVNLRPASRDPLRQCLIPFSAATTQSLEARVADLATHELKDASFGDLLYTLSLRRSVLSKRGYLIASEKTFSSSLSVSHLITLPSDETTSPSNFAFAFTGQGAQWPQMGKELLNDFPVFRNSILEMDRTLQSLAHPPSWTLVDTILEAEATSDISQPTLSQPICTAVQIGLVRLLATWDVLPSAVIGHSSGEIAAAYASGNLTMAEAIATAYYRGYVVDKSARDGAMIAAGVSESAAEKVIKSNHLQQAVHIGCVNSPESVTFSGDKEAIDTILQELRRNGVFARELKTGNRAYHSHHMMEIGEEYQLLLETAFPLLKRCSSPSIRGKVKFFSSVSGTQKWTSFGPDYWRSNLESKVMFTDTLRTLSKEGDFDIVEIGPHSTLQMPIKQTRSHLALPTQKLRYFASLLRNKDSTECMLRLAGDLFLYHHRIPMMKVNGLERGLNGVHDGSGYKVIPDLPPYRWHYDGLKWSEGPQSRQLRLRKHPKHELLGSNMFLDCGRESSWRNVLNLTDVPWLMDHKLGQTVLFPGAGYLAMAIEAVLQTYDYLATTQVRLKLQDVNILKALSLPTEAARSVEVFTKLRAKQISMTSESNDSWEFSITSRSSGIFTTHATGVIALEAITLDMKPQVEAPPDSLEPTAPRVWYNRMKEVGIDFGPAFQSLTEVRIPRSRSVLLCTSRVPLQRSSPGDPSITYPVHPITLDALLQTSIIAASVHSDDKDHARVPTKIGEMTIDIPCEAAHTDDWIVSAQAEVAGIGVIRATAELSSPQTHHVSVRMSDVRFAPYAADVQHENSAERHPISRVVWKSDIGLLKNKDFSKCIDHTLRQSSIQQGTGKELSRNLVAILTLISHKNPALRILEVGNPNEDMTRDILSSLAVSTPFKRLQSYTTGVFNHANELMVSNIDFESWEWEQSKPLPPDQNYDLILLPDVHQIAEIRSFPRRWDRIKALLSENGMLLGVSKEHQSSQIAGAALDINLEFIHGSALEDDKEIFIGRPATGRIANVSKIQQGDKPIVVVGRRSHETSTSILSTALANLIHHKFGQQARLVDLENIDSNSISHEAVVISLLEADPSTPFLAKMTKQEMQYVKKMTDHASAIVWVTAGNILDGTSPDFALASGLARAIMQEQPALQFFTYDVDAITAGNVQQTADQILSVVTQFPPSIVDYEFAQRQDIVHISRFVPDGDLNRQFRMKQGDEVSNLPMKEVKPLQMEVGTPGHFDSIRFKQVPNRSKDQGLEPSEVQLEMTTVGLNAKDFYVLAGKVDTRGATCVLEYCGVVSRIGSNVRSIVVGDRVVVMAPSSLRTTQIVPDWACKKLNDDEDFEVMCTLPVVFSTAIYGLHERAHLKAGESVLIHSAAGGVGMAAIQIAQLAGAEIFATVGSEAKKNFICEEFGINPANVFSSRDASFLTDVMGATGGRGVDVVLNSLTGDLLHASLQCCAQFGRFVEIGKKDLADSGRLNMHHFLKDVTFTAFDLSSLYLSKNRAHNQMWSKLIDDVLELYRARKISKIEPLTVYDIADTAKALRHFGSRNRMGKVAIRLGDDNTKVEVRPFRYNTKFSPDKTYLMIGCLGGLGRSISKWMVARGVRKFIFLGRSGLDRQPARELISDLERRGTSCTIVRGDVCRREDVEAAVAKVEGVLGGVVQAAMGISDVRFSDMSNQSWHTGIDPKVLGTWNLHNAIGRREQELDFFLMTSSVSGSIGRLTQANYCAGNSFLDIFARYRRSLGLHAVAVGLGMITEVGYVHENPEIEALLLRTGITPIREDELLQILDISISADIEMCHPEWRDSHAAGHILTGLEPLRIVERRKQGFEVTNQTFDDPRLLLLASAVRGPTNDTAAFRGRTVNGHRIPAQVAAALESGTTLAVAISQVICKRFSDMILLDVAKVDIARPLAAYGIDSMAASELRSWLFKAFETDIPFGDFLNSSTTLSGLVERVQTNIERE